LGAWLAGAQTRLGRAKQGRGLLLNRRLRLPDNDRTRHVSREYMDLAVEAGASPLEEDYKVRLPLSDESREEQARLFREAGLEEQGPLVGICPTSAFGPAKCWPPAYFAKLAESLRRKGKIPVLFGAPSEKAVLDEIDGASEKKFIRLTTTLPGLAACLSRMKAVVANDSGPLHLAAAMGVPVAGLYGPIDPKWSGPLAGKSRVFYTRIECSPCHQRICPLKHHKCLRDIAPETVFDGLIDLMK
jgi:heptosyltransferase-2